MSRILPVIGVVSKQAIHSSSSLLAEREVCFQKKLTQEENYLFCLMSLDFIAHFAFYSEIFTKMNFFDRGILKADFKEMEEKANKN